jgi:hypothetical protein
MYLIISGPWGTLASAFFFLSSLFGGDLLVLRGCLLMAYAFLLINGLTGLPSWPWAAAPGRMSVSAVRIMLLLLLCYSSSMQQHDLEDIST